MVLSTGFAELAARSHYSFLDGSSSPRELAAAAAAAGLGALGICDRNGLYGAVALTHAARRAGIHPVIGAELDLDGGSRLRLVARSSRGYRQLCRAVSAAQLAGEKGQPRLSISGITGPATAQAGANAPAVAEGRPRGVAVGIATNALSWTGGVSPRVKGGGAPRHLPPPERPAALRTTAGPFPAGWPSLPSTRRPATGPPAVLDPAELDGCTVLAGGPESEITAALLRGDRRGAAHAADRLREAFGRDRVVLLLTHHLHPADGWLVAETAALARRSGLAAMVSNTPVHATTADRPLLDVLTAIRHRTTLDRAAAHGLLLPNAEHRVKSEAELRVLLGEHPEAFDCAAHLAAQCSVALDFSDVRFPGFTVPDGETPLSVLRRLCEEALPDRYRPVTEPVRARLRRELGVIETTGLAEFFLITWDIMRFARERGIPGQGRGSAADSIVAYLLGITRVDPVEHDLLFERFLHEDHQGTPDIDIDFSTEHREEVIQYVYERYGAERTGMVANVVTFRPRMAVRQVGAALDVPEPVVDRLAKSVGAWYMGSVADVVDAAGLDPGEITDSLPWTHFLDLLQRIEGCPRHLGIHVGGMLVTGAPLVDVAPVERATMPGRVVVQFDKDDVEDLGLIKMDLLGLRTLSAVKECLDHVEAVTGERPDLDALPLDDPRVYDVICAADTIGLFQIESRAQQQSLHQSRPRVFNDLIVQVAIIRPGPIQGNAVNPYLRRRQGLEPVTYLHPSLEPILAETHGVVLYQEQILRIVMEVAGYSAGEADRFRRAMNRHRSRVEMAELHDEFIERCVARGIGAEVTGEIFRAVAGFAVYGFCKSHAAAFARTAYETGWLRLHHPAAWLCSLLNAQPMGFYHPSVLVEDGKRHGACTLPVDVGRSRARCTMEWIGDTPPPAGAVAAGLAPGWRVEGDTVRRDPAARPPTAAEHAAVATRRRPRHGGGGLSEWAVRLGFAYVRSLGPEARARCAEAAVAGAGSVAEFWRRTGLPRPAMENLVMVGAFDGTVPGRPRRALLWELRAAEDGVSRPPRRTAAAASAGPPVSGGPPRGRGAIAGQRPGDAPRPAPPELPPPPLLVAPAPAPPLPPMDERERTAAQYRISELSTGPHMVAHLREPLRALGCTPLAEVAGLPDGTRLRVGGLVIARQAPMTAKGFRFFTLADEGGHLDLILRPPVVRRTRSVANFHPLLLVDGRLQSEAGRLNLIVEQVRALDAEGRVLDGRTAALGRGAATDAPRSQHGHTRPSDWEAPASHDFR
ncbi:MAG: error-prone polymerase [Chloroflexota bacterium]|nr:error-prone polymerase [Chloroflexota bacterium]